MFAQPGCAEWFRGNDQFQAQILAGKILNWRDFREYFVYSIFLKQYKRLYLKLNEARHWLNIGNACERDSFWKRNCFAASVHKGYFHLVSG
jgi:hypothetical protein